MFRLPLPTNKSMIHSFHQISNRLFVCTFIFSLLITTPGVYADNRESDARQWLQKMSQAMKQLNYHGTVAFFKSGRLDTMKYFHLVENGQEQEKLFSLNSPMREVVREAGKVRCIFKNPSRVVVNHWPVSESFIVDLPTDFFAPTVEYQFIKQGEEAVAMLPTQVIEIKAKDGFRYNRKIWIDKQHFLPLKMEVYDLSDALLEQVVFTDLEVDKKVPSQTDQSNPFFKTIKKTTPAALAKADFILKNVPPGFYPVFFTRMEVENSTRTVGHLLLSDGFTSVSIYKEPKTTDIQMGLQTLGAVNSFTSLIDNFQITAMGEVPIKTVKFIAQGVRLK